MNEPCPFCGSEPSDSKKNIGFQAVEMVECKTDDCPISYIKIEKSVWNKRPS